MKQEQEMHKLGRAPVGKLLLTMGAPVIYGVFLLFGVVGVPFYIGSQTKNALIAAMANDYLRICCVLSFGMIFFAMFEKLLQATGRSMYSTIAQIAGAVTNIVLD